MNNNRVISPSYPLHSTRDLKQWTNSGREISNQLIEKEGDFLSDVGAGSGGNPPSYLVTDEAHNEKEEIIWISMVCLEEIPGFIT